jgi:hypothetical protein
VAAKQLGLSVLELEEAPAHYREEALMAVSAENWAENERMERAKKR